MKKVKLKLQMLNIQKDHNKWQSLTKFGIGLIVMMLAINSCYLPQVATAKDCPDVQIIFARGSGGERWTNEDYLEFKKVLETKLQTTSLKYEFMDLDYPAVAVGLDHLDTTLGAFISGGESYRFGASVRAGTDEIVRITNSTTCTNTRYILSGYSQGAIATVESLARVNSEKIIYVATFGDPKLYLPEGFGAIPPACSGENLSDYRMYVPDCQAWQGLLGGTIPYETAEYIGKLGTWCNKRDMFCSSHLSLSDHLSYVSEALYEDASRVIFDKITSYYNIENHVSSPHDTAILIDSTGSMSGMIDSYKAEAKRLAQETLTSGGRVALYDYRDLNDPYIPVEHCSFETCTMEVFEYELAQIEVDGGGDTPESLLSASFHVMKDLHWKYGSTKSLVVLTDADFLSPDRDGMTFDEVVKVSKQIDPVNFYIITSNECADDYKLLAERTGGTVVTNFDELSLLTDYIMERYDSLPRVEEPEKLTATTKPTLTIDEVAQKEDAITLKMTTNGSGVIVVLNDAVLGITDQTEITITGMMGENTITLVPINDDMRGEAVRVSANFDTGGFGGVDNAKTSKQTTPKAPNTGRAE